MSDEGMFRPPGAPGGELRPRRPPGIPVPRPPAGLPAHDDTPGPTGPDPDGGTGHRRVLSPETAWRLGGIGAAVAVYLAAGLPWYRIGVDQCVREVGRNDSASLRAACQQVALTGWQTSRWSILLALAAGVVMLVRFVRRGPVLLDLLAPLAAALATALAVRGLFDPADRQLDLTWPGPLTLLPLLGGLTVAGAQVYRLAHLPGVRSLGQAGARLREQVGDRTLRVPNWLRPKSMWRRRRRWLAGAGVLGVVLIAHGCAQQGLLGGSGNTSGVTDARAGGGLGGAGPIGRPNQSGQSGATGGSRPTAPPASPAPDGAHLITAAHNAVARAHTVEITVGTLAGADVTVDLRLTSDRRADGTVTTTRNQYNVRRVGTRCWVQHLPGYGPLAWVPTCTIPASLGFPAIDLAAVTDWTVMVAPLPDPAGARTAATRSGGDTWRVTAADGTTVYLPGDGHADSLPVRVRSSRARPGGATDIDYTDWDGPATITPP